ncbi:hypothetical protein MADA3029_300058 [Vibrio nigripulchritudo MADA3029]|nr:hypothetical protein VIBNIMADA3020_840055 [Vibrio nigripulchritudo MADA3020]CCN54383.1 hypothetical protein VIBNIMADA3021_540057 [Vibrio nigripulchritudo MADA3021]CCN58982.1 hypothetical protein MADA3029_300058 [Vibrio nigripulchritudo MADA3029]
MAFQENLKNLSHIYTFLPLTRFRLPYILKDKLNVNNACLLLVSFNMKIII